jgi:hypothetical protein
MPVITSANIANAIVKLVAVDALPALMGNLVMGNLVNRNYEPSLAQAGDTINIPIPPTLVANNLAEGGIVQTQNPSLLNAQIILNTHAEATFQIPDVTKVLAVPDLLRLYMQPAVIALAERIESDLLALSSQFTANDPLGGPGVQVTEAMIDAAETALFQAKVPATSPKYLVVDANTYSQLRQIVRFSEYHSVGEAGLRTLIDGSVGKMKDFYIFRSQFVPKTGSGPSVTHNVAFAQNALGLVVRRLPQPLPGTRAIAEYAELGNFGIRVTMSYQPNTLAQQFTVDVLYGVGVLRNSFGVQLLS